MKTEIDLTAKVKLTRRAWRFVKLLIGECNFDAAKAYKAAGFDCPDDDLVIRAGRMLHKRHIIHAIHVALDQQRLLPGMLLLIMRIRAMNSMDSFLTVGEDGEPYIDWKKASALRAFGNLKEYKETERTFLANGDTVTTRTIKVFNQADDIRLLMQAEGMFVARHEISGPGGGPIQTENELMIKLLQDAQLANDADSIGLRMALQPRSAGEPDN